LTEALAAADEHENRSHEVEIHRRGQTRSACARLR
jgi:hypothetical protein